MSRKKNILLTLLIISLTGNHCFSQRSDKEIKTEQYRVIHWNEQTGLPGNNSNTMFKDAKGFLWIGSSNAELSRFDGSVFKKYFPENVKSGAINSDTVMIFEEDSLHNIWMGTKEGVSRYDIKVDSFVNFPPYIDSPFTQLGNRRMVVPFWATKDSMYCIEPGGLITAFNIHTLKRKLLVRLAKENHPDISWNTNQAVFDERSKSFWVLRELPGQVGKLQQIFLDGEIIYYSWPCFRKDVIHFRHGAEDMHYDPKRNSIWINSGEGLLEFSLNDKQFHLIDALNDLLKLKEYDRSVGIDIDQKGRIWFATSPKGILLYDPQTKRIEPVFSDPDLQQQTGKSNLHIYCDRDGIIWTSDWNLQGIFQLVPFDPLAKRYTPNPEKKNSLSSGQISTIIPGPGGKLWIGTAAGLNIFDPVTESFEVLRQKDFSGLQGEAIIPVYIDTVQQKAWLRAGTQNPYEYYGMKMYEMDMKTQQCRQIVFKDGSVMIDTFTVAHTWIKPYKDGLIFCDEAHGVFEIKKNSLVANLVFSLKAGMGGMTLVEDHYLFLQHAGAMPNFTLENKDGKWMRIAHPFDSLQYYALLYNKKDKTYWAGLRKELKHFDNEFRLIKSYGRKDGYSGMIKPDMMMDNKNNIWFVSELNKAGQFNMTTGIISFLSESDGYYKQEYAWFLPSAKDAMGNIYFGVGSQAGIASSHWGLDRINPKSYSSVISPSVYLRSISVNQKPYALTTNADQLDELSLKYNQNNLRIEMGIIDFFSKQKGQIRYKLERNSKPGDWEYSMDHIIRYEDLQPGSYKLITQAANSNSEFNSPERIFKINISPPFWQTWWFRAIALIFLIDLIYSIVRWRMRQKFKLQIERSEKETQMAEMRQKTAELLQQKTELEMQALRAQMNPHFIFNSLNSINRFILQNNKAQASEYLTKFSKLVRLILQNSQASLISLESELQALELYLDLEALRFDYRFGYKISVPKDLDIEALKVPPLIIQPYTENAIWHGLMHKEDKGQLDIEVSEEGDHLYFKIADNGVGRKQAAAMASKSATKHKSMGLRITQERIAILQKVNGESPVKIIDLENADGSAAGTEVIIKMPVIFGD